MHSIQVLVRPQFRSIYHLIQYLTHLHPSSQTWYIGSILLFYFWPTHLEHIVLQILPKSILSSFKTSLKSFSSCHNPDLPVSAWIKLCAYDFLVDTFFLCVWVCSHMHIWVLVCVCLELLFQELVLQKYCYYQLFPGLIYFLYILKDSTNSKKLWTAFHTRSQTNIRNSVAIKSFWYKQIALLVILCNSLPM